MAISENSSTDAKNIADISYTNRVIYSQFCAKFRCRGNGGSVGEKCDWQHL